MLRVHLATRRSVLDTCDLADAQCVIPQVDLDLRIDMQIRFECLANNIVVRSWGVKRIALIEPRSMLEIANCNLEGWGKRAFTLFFSSYFIRNRDRLEPVLVEAIEKARVMNAIPA